MKKKWIHRHWFSFFTWRFDGIGRDFGLNCRNKSFWKRFVVELLFSSDRIKDVEPGGNSILTKDNCRDALLRLRCIDINCGEDDGRIRFSSIERSSDDEWHVVDDFSNGCLNKSEIIQSSFFFATRFNEKMIKNSIFGTIERQQRWWRV